MTMKRPPRGMTSESRIWRRTIPNPIAQERLVRRFSEMAATEDRLELILEDACMIAAEGVAACWARMLRYWPKRRGLCLEAGIGRPAFRHTDLGHASCSESAAVSAWERDRPERSQSRVCEHRFDAAGVWAEFRSFRTMCIPVPGDDDVPFGVIEVGSLDTAAFLDQDAAFLIALAGHLAKRLQRPHATDPIAHPEWFVARRRPIPPRAVL